MLQPLNNPCITQLEHRRPCAIAVAAVCPFFLQILAVASDHIIRVWCAHSGALLHLLRGHTQPTHVLDTHPFDARLALSAGYDGQVILWDIAAGTVLKR